MIPTITHRELFAILLLLFCASCREKPARVWSCFETEAKNGCACALVDPRDGPGGGLCSQEYECCVLSFESMDSQSRTSCDCWNPSQGGPKCESKLPPPGQESAVWKRVDRCKKW